MQPIEVRGPGGLDSAFAALLREQVTALVVLPDPMFRNQHKRIIELAAQQRLPTMYWSRELVDAGGLMPGHGESAKLPVGSRLEEFVAWFGRFLDEMEIEATNVAGHSMAAALDYTRTKTIWLRTSDDPIPDPFVMR